MASHQEKHHFKSPTTTSSPCSQATPVLVTMNIYLSLVRARGLDLGQQRQRLIRILSASPLPSISWTSTTTTTHRRMLLTPPMTLRMTLVPNNFVEPPPSPDPTWQHLRPSTATVDLDADENLADFPDAGNSDGLPNTGILNRLHCNRPSDAAKIVARLHRNLGYPTVKDLKKLLADKGASATVLKAVDDHRCPTCYRLRPPTQSAKSGLQSTFQFNERLMADTIWLQVQGKPVPVVTIMDAGTCYMAARAIKKENTAEFILALERGWFRTFGPPLVLQVDSHRAWGSDSFREFATDHDFQVIISPGEAHNRLAQLERRHMVLRTAVEHYMAERSLDDFSSLKEALTYVLPQINSTLSVGGFSPTQWVLGYQLHIPGSLLDSHVNQAHLSPTEAFQQRMQYRALASTAVIKADADQRLRWALLRQHRGAPPPLHVGQRCYYYRECAGVGPRVRWKGPATVVLVEADSSQRPNIYWLVHGSALLRAAPEHVRPDLEATTLAGDAVSLHDLVRNVQNCGTTTYTDLVRTTRKRPRPGSDYLTDDEIVENDGFSAPAPSLPLPLPLAPPAAAEPLAPTPAAAPPAPHFEPEPPPSRQTTVERSLPGMSSGPADVDMHPALLPAPEDGPALIDDLDLPSLNDDESASDSIEAEASVTGTREMEASLPADADVGLDTPRPLRLPRKNHMFHMFRGLLHLPLEDHLHCQHVKFNSCFKDLSVSSRKHLRSVEHVWTARRLSPFNHPIMDPEVARHPATTTPRMKL